MKFSAETKLCAGLLLAFILLVSGVVLSYRNAVLAIETGKSVKRSMELLGAMESLLLVAKDMERKSRAYTNSGDEKALRQFRKARSAIAPHLDFIKDVSASDERSFLHSVRVEALIRAIENNAQDLIDRRSRKERISVPPLTEENYSPSLQSLISLIIYLETEERELLKFKMAEYETSTNKFVGTFTVLSVIVSIFFASLLFLLHRHLTLAKRSTESEMRVAADIIRHAPIGILKLSADLVVLGQNPTFLAFSQMSSENLSGKNIEELFPDINGDQVRETLRNAASFQIDKYPTQLGSTNQTEQLRSEPYRVWQISFWPIIEADALKGAIALIVDITEKQSLSEQKNLFLQTVTHDLKSPLVASDYLLQALLSEVEMPLKNEQKELLVKVKRTNEDVLRMVQNLLELSRYKEDNKVLRVERASISELVRLCIRDMEPLADMRSVKLSIIEKQSNLLAETDRTAFQHMVANLIANAIKFSHRGDEVTVSLASADGKIVLRVKDSGPGIQEEERKHLFAKFWQGEIGKGTPGGTGLGLYLCYHIAITLGAQLTYENSEEGGSVFAITLPQVDGSPPLALEAVASGMNEDSTASPIVGELHE